MVDGVVHVEDQFVSANFSLGLCIFIGRFWCNSSQEIVLIDFLFAGKNIEDQELHSSEKYGYDSRFAVIIIYILGDTSPRDFTKQ
jgi:hypothetical protein